MVKVKFGITFALDWNHDSNPNPITYQIPAKPILCPFSNIAFLRFEQRSGWAMKSLGANKYVHPENNCFALFQQRISSMWKYHSLSCHNEHKAVIHNFIEPTCGMHNRLICVAFCLSVCPSVTGPKFTGPKVTRPKFIWQKVLHLGSCRSM